MKTETLRKAGCAGGLLGLAALIGGFCYDVIFAGIPYQDPTPELERQYELHCQVASYLEMAGALILAIGCLLWLAGFVCKWRCERAARADGEDADA
jgi:hypothetical protein